MFFLLLYKVQQSVTSPACLELVDKGIFNAHEYILFIKKNYSEEILAHQISLKMNLNTFLLFAVANQSY